MDNRPKRNYLGQPLNVPARCGACKGTGYKQGLRADRTFAEPCSRCRGSGMLYPEPDSDRE
jgi:DnaJ-class molecular chaperone